MTAIAPPQHYGPISGQPSATGGRSTERESHSQVIETSGEQPWAEFCKDLKAPAFLLAVTSFGDPD